MSEGGEEGALSMTKDEVAQLIKECEPIIQGVINHTGLARYFHRDRDEAKAWLSEIVLRYKERFHVAPDRARWVMLARRAVSIIRKEKRRSSAEVPSVRFVGGKEWHDLLSYVPAEQPSSPEQDAAASEILSAIAELSEREQDMLYDYVNDVPSDETGAALGISGGRVRQVWKQIFTKLRAKL